MTIQDSEIGKLGTLLVFVPPMPHYCDDLKVQRRVGEVISAFKQPSNFRVRTIWL